MRALTAVFIKNAPPGKHEDGQGLRLIKRTDGGGQWVFRYMLHGRRREMGLGGLGAVSLKDAREFVASHRTILVRGIDPIKHRQQLRRDAERDLNLLRGVSIDAFDCRKAELKDDGKAGRRFSPLELHILSPNWAGRRSLNSINRTFAKCSNRSGTPSLPQLRRLLIG